MTDYTPSAEELAYLEKYDPSAWPRPSVTADLMVLAGKTEKKLLLVRRGGFPYRGWWALPGGFCEPFEPPELTAARELSEETGVSVPKFSLLGVFGGPNRDPRGWTVTCAYLALTDEEPPAKAADDAEAALWFSPELTEVSREGDKVTWELTLTCGDTVIGAEILQNEKIYPPLPETGLTVLGRRGIAFDHAKFIAAAILHQKQRGLV